MSILNSAGDGFANILLVLCKYLIKNGSQDKDDLLEIFSLGRKEINVPFKETLKRWTDLELFNEVNNQVFFSNHLIEKYKKINTENLRSALRYIIFFDKNNPRLFTSKEARSGDFTTAASWVLAQSLHVKGGNYEVLQESQIPDVNKRPLQTNTRYNGLLQYMTILGFASGNGSNYILDPTPAIEDELKNVFNNKNILTANEFLKNLAEIIPILDFGKYRKEVEDYLRSDVFKKTNQLELSETLSFALSRLKEKGILSFESKGDADKVFNFFNFFGDTSINPPFSHVNLLGG